MKNSVIGIIGGMCPQASCELYRLLIDKSVLQYGVKDDKDFPSIVLYSLAVPDIIKNKKNFNETLEILKSSFKKINTYELSSVSIACNTVHVFVPNLKDCLGDRFVSMPESVVLEVERNKLKTIGLMATPVTLKSRLYQELLDKAGIRTITPGKQDVNSMEKVIRNVLAGNSTKQDVSKLVNIALSLRKKGAEGIILGCTELPLIFPKDFNMPVFNSLEILAERLLRRYYKF